ncbi:MAG: helix-turn-helix transcriptional regulator [Bacteroidota bacterium]
MELKEIEYYHLKELNRFQNQQCSNLTQKFHSTLDLVLNITHEIRNEPLQTKEKGIRLIELNCKKMLKHTELLLYSSKKEKTPLQPPDHKKTSYISERQETKVKKEAMVPTSNHYINQEHNQDDPFLKKIYDLVESNLGDSNFGNKQLAKQMHLSNSQLYRKLKSKTGRSPALYIRSIRLQKAREMLLNSNLTVVEIAYDTGFNTPSYFTRTFSKEFGVLPSEIRK